MTVTRSDRVGTAAEPMPSRPWWRSTLAQHSAWSLVGIGVIYLLSSSLSAYRDLQIAQICYTAIAAAGLTVLAGLSGQISLGQGAFMAIGGYVTALLMIHLSWPLALVLAIATVLTAASGAIVGVAAARLRGPYLAGATLALAVGLPSLADYHRFRSFFGGANGLIVAPSPPPAGLGAAFPLERWQAWICGFCLVITLFLLANLSRSKVGRDMRVVREDEDAAALCGVHVARSQVLAFTVSAGCAGLGGALLAWVNSLAAPGAFPLALSLSLLTAAVIGGLGSLSGAVAGAALVTLLPTWATNAAQSAGLSQNIYANVPLVVYGAALILVVIFFPGGLQRVALWALHLVNVTIRRQLR